ncbi:MBG domain-containing protein [Aquabacter spiritensis]|uniref:Filamentous hemagglutinin family protein n=1 Tax=Aquabacter spiritensis TaxID=933073 RepID=A0A4R3LL81_9HYPH|nr:MBG domain-containing protein [Aquabacter spiritensis]TCT01090.1 filamentous hemagglutinin family protein [Aquabacter spiritensis]
MIRIRSQASPSYLLASVAFLVMAAPVHGQSGLPTAPSVRSGAAVVASPSATSVLVTQSSAKAIINWGSFSIGAGNSVRFENGSGVTLNRVTGFSPSQIDGSLSASGSLYLVNPNGIAIGPGGSVMTGGAFIASTHDVADAEFLAGGAMTFKGASTASVTNYGSIGSLGGDVALIARKVENAGTLTAPAGTAALAAGYEVLVRDGALSDGRFVVKVGGADTEAKTSGVIKAAEVELKANGGNVYALAGNTESLTRAKGVATQGGRIFLTAGSGTVRVTQKVSARRAAGASGKAKGGEIRIAGGVVDQSGTLDAEGEGEGEAGGAIRVDATSLYHVGQMLASGNAGGTVTLRAAALLNAGVIDVSATEGAGGAIDAQASDTYVETAAGSLRADGGTAGGRITLDAPRVFSSGTLTANAAQGTGGTLTLTGSDIDLVAARLDASGAKGGGTIRVGGDYQGGATLPAAKTLDISPATRITADATSAGAGGSIVLWSDEATAFYGTVSANAGPASGDGGAIEISSKGLLTMAGTATASAANGAKGILLLDPKNIVIDDATGVLAQYELIDPSGGQAGTSFGTSVVPLSNGNVFVSAPSDDFGALDVGAAYLFNGTTGALISAIYGDTAGNSVASQAAIELTNGNYVFGSPNWDNGSTTNVGAVTWANGTTGISGVISSLNSVIGTTGSDFVGSAGVVALPSGNYLIRSPNWDNGSLSNAGAVTWANGATGSTGFVSISNSLVGGSANDNVGSGASGVVVLTNGNYVVVTQNWDNGAVGDVGAVTWGSGTGGVSGLVSSANSLVGSTASDTVGLGGVLALANGNYVVQSPYWDNGGITNAGAATWGSGTGGIVGAVSSTNSLVGGKANDQVGLHGVTALTNGNYVVLSPNWDNGSVSDAGAATWGNGTTGVSGLVSSTNSLVGSTANNQVSYQGVTALTNGNYVVRSAYWDNASVQNVGAVTWGNGSTGTVGVVSSSNSLVGSSSSDQAGSGFVLALANGNYVVGTSGWDNGNVSNVGAVTWGSGTSGVTGTVSISNSLIGSTANDQVGSSLIVLTNGHYVVLSPNWDNGSAANAGAATWGNGATGITGLVSSANSLVGSASNDSVGYKATALTNGNYVVATQYWNNGNIAAAGAVTWGNGATGIAGVVSSANSLVGSTANDNVGNGNIVALANGNYVVRSHNWDNGSTVNAGAVTWGNGATGITGVISSANSLVGWGTNAYLGNSGLLAFANGDYVVVSGNYRYGIVTSAGAVTWGSGASGITGVVSAQNSLIAPTSSTPLASSGSIPSADIFLASGGGRVYVGLTEIDAASGGLTFARATGQSVTLTSAALTAVLNSGTDLVLQASNDITVQSAVISSTAASLTLEAGRSILLSVNVSVGGDLTLRANAPQSAGVVAADRDAGAAVIDAEAVTLAAGGTLTLTLDTGAGRDENGSGNILLGAVSADTLAIANLGPTDGSAITLSTSISTVLGQTYTGALLISAANVVLSAGTEVTWTDEATASIFATTAGNAISFVEGGTTTRIGVLDTADAARIAMGSSKASRAYGDSNPDVDTPVLVSGTMRAGDSIDTLLSPEAVFAWDGGSAPTQASNAGDYGYTLSGSGVALAPGAQGYFVDVSPITGVLTVTPAILSVTADPGTMVYGDAVPTGFGYTSSGWKNGQDASLLSGVTVTTNATSTANVGTGYATTAAGGVLSGAAAGNYTLSYVGGSFAVTARPITVTADAQSMTYGDSVPALTYAVTAGSLVNGDTLAGALATTATPTANVGTYGITQGTLGNANYAIGYVGANVTIGAAPLTVTADPGTMIYGDDVPTLGYTSAGWKNGQGPGQLSGVTVTTNATSTANVGTGYATTAAGGVLSGAAAGNYTLSYVGGSFAVTARSITVTADAQSMTYGDSVPALTYAVTAGSLVNGDTLAGALATMATPTADVGTYGITQGTLANANYAIGYVGANVTIGARPITVTADAQSMTYGDSVPALTYAVTAGSLVNGDTLAGALATTATPTADVGTYGITQGTLGNANYAIGYVGANVTIGARPITVTADAQSMTYGDSVPALTYAVTAGSLVNGDTLAGALATMAAPTADVGTYGISQGTLAASSNYALNYLAADVTIGRRAVTVTALDQSRPQGAANPIFTYLVGGLGLVNGDDFQGSLSTPATPLSPPGSYPILQGSLSLSENYTVAYVEGSLTVLQTEFIIIPQPPPDQWAVTAETVSLIATSEAGEAAPDATSGCRDDAVCPYQPHPDNRSFGRWLSFRTQ